ncbi:MAG: response regulator transcription factor [Gemmatimonadales bacterium]
MYRVLFVEDSRGMAQTVREHLAVEGYQVDVADSPADGLARIRRAAPHLVVLDLMSPDGSGEHLLASMRAEGIDSAVLILSANGDGIPRVPGFRIGADDYLAKPFGILELLHRVGSLIHGNGAERPASDVIRFGQVEVQPARKQVLKNGQRIQLRPREFELLVALLRRPGRAWSRRELLDHVWGYDPTVESRTVDWHMAELRRKLEAEPATPRFLQTVRKVGYRFDYCEG